MMKKLALVICVIGLGGMVGLSSGDTTGGSIQEQCTAQIQQLGNCLTYVAGKKTSNEPSKECCNSVSSMKDTKPVCLCLIISEVHNGTNLAIKSLGLQEPKLLQLPSACHLNASLADCPKLLKISPSSPAAAIFENATASAASTSPVTSSPDKSSGSKHSGVLLLGSSLIVTLLITIIPTINISF